MEKFIEQDLELNEAALHFNVSDQYLSWGNPFNSIESKNAKKLFDLSAAEGNKMFLAFNRVINDRADRKGCGARKVILAFEP